MMVKIKPPSDDEYRKGLLKASEGIGPVFNEIARNIDKHPKAFTLGLSAFGYLTNPWLGTGVLLCGMTLAWSRARAKRVNEESAKKITVAPDAHGPK